MTGISIADTIYTFRFLKLLSTKWENTDAFKYKIIDAVGKPLKKSADLTTTEEKKSYTPFIRLIFKLKRLMGTIPGGKSAVARYGAAIALIKEHKEEVDKMGINFGQLEKSLKQYFDREDINEEVTNSVGGIEGKDQLLGKKKKVIKRKDDEENEENEENKDKKKNEDSKYVYQVIGNHLVRAKKDVVVDEENIDEIKRVMKKRVKKGKRSKKREFVPTKRKTRTGGKKLRGAKLAKKRKSLKKAIRKAHTGSAKAKRKRSMKKSRKYK